MDQALITAQAFLQMQRKQAVCRKQRIGILAFLFDLSQGVDHPCASGSANLLHQRIVGQSQVALLRGYDFAPILREIPSRNMSKHSPVTCNKYLHMKNSAWPIASNRLPISSGLVSCCVLAE